MSIVYNRRPHQVTAMQWQPDKPDTTAALIAWAAEHDIEARPGEWRRYRASPPIPILGIYEESDGDPMGTAEPGDWVVFDGRWWSVIERGDFADGYEPATTEPTGGPQ